MLPYSLPSSVSAFGRTQMKAYPYTPQAGDVAWVDYIPVRFVPENFQEGTYNRQGFVAIDIISTPTGKQAWVDYVPVVIDDTRTDAWLVNRVGYIPVNYSGTGDGTTANKGLSLNFLGADRLDPRITFSRASNATVTNSSGLIVNAPMNLLTFSEQFDNSTWVKARATVTANTTIAPNGTTTADKLVEDSSASTTHLLRYDVSVTTGNTFTYSVYAKAAERTQIQIGFGADNSAFTLTEALFTLSGNGTATTVSGSPAAVISPVGDGWYRCSIVGLSTATAVASLRLFLANSNSASYTGNGTSGLFIWGAQLNVGSLQPYYPTTVKNLVGFSEAFDNAAWTKSNCTVSANTSVTAAPNGTFTADKLVENATTAPRFTGQTASFTTGVPYTLSYYVKAAERTFARVGFSASAFPAAGRAACFNLSTGAVGDVQTGVTASITSVGNGWYRCSITVTATATASSVANGVFIGLQTIDTAAPDTYTGDGTSGFYIWGAQLSDSASLDPYVNNPVAAPSSTAFYGARFDYDPVTLQPRGLLIEEQRTNLLLRSQNYAATWIVASATPTANTTDTLDPAGLNEATKFVIGASSGALLQPVISTAVSHTGSVYLKVPSGTTTVDLVLYRGSPYALVAVKTVTVTSAWQRFDVTGTFVDTTSHNFQISFGTNKTVYVWGAQVEAGSFATSYIPTVASQVTRSADTALIQGSNFSGWYNQSEGTIFGNYSTANTTGRPVITPRATATADNRIQFGTSSSIVVVSGSVQANIGSGTNITSGKQAFAYKLNDFAGIIQGSPVSTTVGTDTSGTVPTVDYATLGYFDFGGGERLNGYIRQLAYYPRRLNSSELQALTAI